MDIKDHKFLTYKKNKPGRRIIRELTKDILNIYLKKDFGITKLKKIKEFSLDITQDNKSWTSKIISYDIIEKYLFENNSFIYKEYNLYEFKCKWLDGNVDVSKPQHFISSDNKSLILSLPLPFGNNFPINPKLDREGWIFNSFQTKLSQRIVVLHNRLILNSNNFQDAEWLFDFLELISCCVSLVDILLNQLYIKAEYDPEIYWNFDKSIIGERFNRRIKDKLDWVKYITGNPLDNVEQEMKSFIFLKNIRNHTQHFDPPCFGFSLEDMTSWLNMISDIGLLVYKIRKKIGSTLNESLIKIILLPEVEFNGVVPFDRERLPHIDVGYQTTIWPIMENEIKDK